VGLSVLKALQNTVRIATPEILQNKIQNKSQKLIHNQAPVNNLEIRQ